MSGSDDFKSQISDPPTAKSLKTKRRLLVCGMIAGILMILVPMMVAAAGLLMDVKAIARGGVLADPTDVSAGLSLALKSAAVCFVMSPFAVTTFIVSLVFYLRARKQQPHTASHLA